MRRGSSSQLQRSTIPPNWGCRRVSLRCPIALSSTTASPPTSAPSVCMAFRGTGTETKGLQQQPRWQEAGTPSMHLTSQSNWPLSSRPQEDPWSRWLSPTVQVGVVVVRLLCSIKPVVDEYSDIFSNYGGITIKVDFLFVAVLLQETQQMEQESVRSTFLVSRCQTWAKTLEWTCQRKATWAPSTPQGSFVALTPSTASPPVNPTWKWIPTGPPSTKCSTVTLLAWVGVWAWLTYRLASPSRRRTG